ncbi:MAG: SDR family oxidoreductase [Culicoidibacterales bacterium]
MSMQNKVVVITGGTGVLCSEIAKDYYRNGAKVIILSLAVREPLRVFKEAGFDFFGYDCDVLDKKRLGVIADKLEQKYGHIDVLINGAGGNHVESTTTNECFSVDDLENAEIRSFFDITETGFESVFNLNFMGTFLPTQIFLRLMIKSGGNVLNISSMSAYAPMTKVPAYSASKAAINNFTQWLAVHFAQNNIRVNAIAPGFFLTKQNQTLLTNEDGSLKERSIKIINSTPMKRFGVPGDLLGAVRFLTDDEQAGFVTGVTLPIDGGFMAYSGV